MLLSKYSFIKINFLRTLTIGGFTLGIAVWAIAPVYSYQPPVTPSTPSSRAIAQLTEASSPIYGTWKLQFSIEGVIYNSVLTMRGYSGTMRTWFFNTRIGRTDAIDQIMSLKSSAHGLVLLGSNPVYADTNIPARYNPDNFLFRLSTDGSLVAVTCDAIIPDRCSPVDVEFVR